MSGRRRMAVATAAIYIHVLIAAFIGFTFTGAVLIVVAVPWFASGCVLSWTLVGWVSNGVQRDDRPHCTVCHHPARRRYWARRGLMFRRVWLCTVDAFPSSRAEARREGMWV